MTAYDLWFETDAGTLDDHGGEREARALPQRVPDGWIGSAGPAIPTATWPRGPRTGLPMLHALTLRLPQEWVAHNDGMAGLALFQGEGQFAAAREADPGDPFEQQRKEAAQHPRLRLLTDIIGGRFALLRLSEEELAGGPKAPPTDVRRPGEHGPDDEGPNAWDERVPMRRVWLLPREDPNAGKAPVDSLGAQDADGYEQPWTPQFDVTPWARALTAPAHLGGTAFPVQQMPAGLGPWYLELHELPGMNLGGDGCLQLDLESGVFDWACG